MHIIYGIDFSLAICGLLCAALFFGLQGLCFRSKHRHLWVLPLGVVLAAAAGNLAVFVGLTHAADLRELITWFVAGVFALGTTGIALAWLVWRLLDGLRA